jgi:hypothetical protein
MGSIRRTLIRCLAILAAGIFLPAAECANERVALNVDLDALNQQAFIELIRSSIPELSAFGSRTSTDFPTLFQVEKHFLRTPVPDDPQKAAAWRGTQREVEALLREQFSKVDLAALRRLGFDSKTGEGDLKLTQVLVHWLIAAEVSRVCADRKLIPHFTSEIVPLPSWVPYQFSPTQQQALSPFAKMLADSAKKPRLLSQEGAYGAYDSLTRSILQGRSEKPIAFELLRFQDDSKCGAGAGEFTDVRWSLIFLQLLRERKIAEAVGASMLVTDSPSWLREPGRPFDRWRMDFLKFCGVDGEELLIATKRFDYLAAAGSEKAARAVLEETKQKWSEPSERAWNLKTLSLFLIPGPSDQWNDEDPRKRISPELQSEIFKLLNGSIDEESAFDQLASCMAILEDLRRPETRAILERLLKHPSTTYAERAASVLRNFGDQIPLIAPAPPVRFRVYLNDKPWVNAELGCRIMQADGSAVTRPDLSDVWMQCSKTDADGFLTIARDQFLDPSLRGPILRFLEVPSGSGSNMMSTEQYNDPWAEADVPTPKDFAQITEVRLSASAWPIEITYASPLPSGSQTTTYFRVTKNGKESPMDQAYYLTYQDRMRAPEKLTLGRLGPGKYRLSIIAPGSARYQSEAVEVKPGTAPLQVKLEKGCYVYASILVPVNGRGQKEVRLYRGEEDVTDTYAKIGADGPLFLGVPKGKYQLRVLSTEEFMRLHELTKWEPPTASWAPDNTKAIDCEGVAVDFNVDDSSPALLDLGQIENKAVESMRSKVTGLTTIGGSPIAQPAQGRK